MHHDAGADLRHSGTRSHCWRKAPPDVPCIACHVNAESNSSAIMFW